MEVRLIHPFRFTGPWGDLLKGVDTLAKFENRMKKMCDIDTQGMSEESKIRSIRCFLGNAFEVFTEMLLKSHPYDRWLGVSKYRPHHSLHGDEDHGVDGSGVGTNGRPATVQCKFRGNPTEELTANGAHLSNFKNASHEEYGVVFTDTDNMLIVTNCKGLHFYTEEKMLNKKVRCMGRDKLKEFVDNNIPFWDEFRRATLPVIKEPSE